VSAVVSVEELAELVARIFVRHGMTPQNADGVAQVVAAPWPDGEPFATTGLIALAVANGRPRIAVWGARERILGTNPMAFACPRAGLPPLVWDQASSIIAQGEVLLAATRGHQLPPGIGLDAEGISTLDPNAVLQGGSMMPFGGYKGSSIAFMIEVLAAGLTGGRFGFEDNSTAYPGAQSSNAGEVVILIDPLHIEQSHFFERIELLLEHIAASGVERLPAEHRYECRERTLREGIAVSDQKWTKLHDLLA
jgi:delta1-piperideine-2-carboxylate reductase